MMGLIGFARWASRATRWWPDGSRYNFHAACAASRDFTHLHDRWGVFQVREEHFRWGWDDLAGEREHRRRWARAHRCRIKRGHGCSCRADTSRTLSRRAAAVSLAHMSAHVPISIAMRDAQWRYREMWRGVKRSSYSSSASSHGATSARHSLAMHSFPCLHAFHAGWRFWDDIVWWTRRAYDYDSLKNILFYSLMEPTRPRHSKRFYNIRIWKSLAHLMNYGLISTDDSHSRAYLMSGKPRAGEPSRE